MHIYLILRTQEGKDRPMLAFASNAEALKYVDKTNKKNQEAEINITYSIETILLVEESK